MVNLPGALISFSQSAVRNIEGLAAIQKTVANPQTTVLSNVSGAATKSITANPLYANVEGFMSNASTGFVRRLTGPAGFSPSLQQESFSQLFGSFLTTGSSVTGFLNANVRLEDIIPAQQLYSILNNLGVSSLYSDPLQAYVQVNTASKDLCNLCLEAIRVIGDVEADLTKFLTIQTGVNYASVQQMDFEFFGVAKNKAAGVKVTLSVLVDTFNKRGRFDAAEVGAFCAAANALAEFVSFADTKLLELSELRTTIIEALQRLQVIGQSIVQVLENVAAYVPQYISSVVFGKLFQALQGKVLDLAGVDIQQVLDLMEALSHLSADDATKLGAIFSSLGTIETIRAFICYLDPSGDVQSSTGPLAPLKTAYDDLTQGLGQNNPNTLFRQLELRIEAILPMLNTAVTRDNKPELSSEVAAIGLILTPLALFLSNCCNVANIFSGIFSQQTAGLEDRIQGVDVLYTDAGLDSARNVALSSNMDQVAVIPMSEATTPGELATALAERIRQLPDGYERDRLQEVYDRVYARHRATVWSMDFQRRQDTALASTLTRAEEEERIIKEEVERYG